MFKAEVSKRSKVILFTLLIILNIVLRIPSIPHEKGGDSFFIHSLANSITTFGMAEWWINWLSIFGLYPYSYASSVPFALSGVGQLTNLTGIHMEIVILLFSIILGLFSIFVVYSLAGTICNDFLFKYLMSLFFSTSQAIMTFSTWEISARGPFLILFPLFLFILLKDVQFTKKFVLIFIISLLLAATHHYFYFVGLMLGIYIIFFKFINIIQLKYQLSWNKSTSILYFITIVLLFMIPFFNKSMITAGSRYDWVIDLIVINIRYLGPSIIFSVGGLIYLLSWSHKKDEVWYILLALMVFVPFAYDQKHGVFTLALFAIFLISVGFRNLFNRPTTEYQKIHVFFIIGTLLVCALFTSYYNNERTGGSESHWYMSETAYTTAEWTNAYIPENANGFGDSLEIWRIFAQSDAHPRITTKSAANLAYGFVDEADIEINSVSPFSINFYYDGPYSLKKGTTVWGNVKWFFELNDINDGRAINIIERYDAKYIFNDIHSPKPIMGSIRYEKNLIYESGRIEIWEI